jgi:SAM-dependent methyltransferase
MGVTAAVRVDGGDRPEPLLRELLDTRAAFDGVAGEYHRQNCENRILVAMRARAVATLCRHVRRGARVLDLGCGPGTDIETLVEAGFTVTAIDWSPVMVEEARRRLLANDIGDCRARVHLLGIQELARLRPAVYDAAYSNFGPLNCVPSLEEAAALVSDRLVSSGIVVASIIGRVCPWEIALHLVRRDWKRVRVRFSRHFVPVPLSGGTVWTRYYSPREFAEAFARAGLRTIALRPLGLFMPPPYMQSFAERHPRLMGSLQRIEDRGPAWGGWGDHFLIVLRKT